MATLAITIMKWFSEPLARKKSPKVSILEAESSHRRHDSTSFLEKEIFQKVDHTAPPRSRYFTAGRLRTTRPAPVDNSAIEANRGYMDIPLPA